MEGTQNEMTNWKGKMPRRVVRLAAAAAILLASVGSASIASAKPLPLEKEELKLGFIKLTDMAPLAIAYEKHFFEDEGLFVTLEPQANWKVLLDRVITGELDGAHMLAGQPLGATIGFGTQAHIITAYSMDLNGNGITVSNEVWEMMKPGLPKGPDGKPKHPIEAKYLKPVVEKFKQEGKSFNMGMVFPSRPTTTSFATGWRRVASDQAIIPPATSPVRSRPMCCCR